MLKLLGICVIGYFVINILWIVLVCTFRFAIAILPSLIVFILISYILYKVFKKLMK